MPSPFRGIRQAIDAGARVVNLSVQAGGGSISTPAAMRDALKRAIRFAAERDVLVVLAAGNVDWDHDDELLPTEWWSQIVPVDRSLEVQAYRNNVIITTCHDQDDQVHGCVRGAVVELAAPGIGIATGLPTGAVEVWESPASSLASPLVTGSAALLFCRRPELTGSEAKRILLEGVRVAPAQSTPLLDTLGALTHPDMGGDPRIGPETCNGLDDDCNGLTDDGTLCPQCQRCDGALGICQADEALNGQGCGLAGMQRWHLPGHLRLR